MAVDGTREIDSQNAVGIASHWKFQFAFDYTLLFSINIFSIWLSHFDMFQGWDSTLYFLYLTCTVLRCSLPFSISLVQYFLTVWHLCKRNSGLLHNIVCCSGSKLSQNQFFWGEGKLKCCRINDVRCRKSRPVFSKALKRVSLRLYKFSLRRSAYKLNSAWRSNLYLKSMLLSNKC